MDLTKKSNIVFVNELEKNNKIYRLYPKKIFIGNYLILMQRLKKLFFKKNKFPILHAVTSSIIFSKPNLKKYFLIRKILFLLRKFSKYPYSLIYQKNTILELKLLSDETINSEIKSKILTDRISFINTTETEVHKYLYPLDLSDHVFLMLHGLRFF